MLKIQGSDYATLRDFVAPFYGVPRAAQYKAAGLSRRRYLWDGLHASRIQIGDDVGTHGDVDIYAYADDRHIESALNAIENSVISAALAMAVIHMDDDIREDIHSSFEHAGDAAAFLAEYERRHEIKFGEIFTYV